MPEVLPINDSVLSVIHIFQLVSFENENQSAQSPQCVLCAQEGTLGTNMRSALGFNESERMRHPRVGYGPGMLSSGWV